MIDGSLTNQDLKYIYNKWGLTKRQKDCITYYFLNKKTQREIAILLGISQPTVKQHIDYAKKKAKKYLSNEHK